MSLIDLILNIAGLLLWLNWLSRFSDPLARTSAASLVGTLRKADTTRFKRWKYLGALAAMLVLRAALYWGIGGEANWTPTLPLCPIVIFFRNDFAFQTELITRMLLFSALSFGLTLAIFYLWLLFFSIVNFKLADLDPMQKLVRDHLGFLERIPWVLKWFLPFWVAGLIWLGLGPLLSYLNIIPSPHSNVTLFEQAAIIGAGSYMPLKFLIAGVLLLSLLNTYVYLGAHPFWSFINTTSRNLLTPLSWLPLRIGAVDLTPLAAAALLFLTTEFASRELTALYGMLPL